MPRYECKRCGERCVLIVPDGIMSPPFTCPCYSGRLGQWEEIIKPKAEEEDWLEVAKDIMHGGE